MPAREPTTVSAVSSKPVFGAMHRPSSHAIPMPAEMFIVSFCLLPEELLVMGLLPVICAVLLLSIVIVDLLAAMRQAH